MKILCPIDYSSNAMMALETAIYYTKLLDADLHIVNVVSKESDVKSSEDQMNQMLAGISAVSEVYINPTVAVLVGYVSEEVIQYGNRNQIDCIIMGTKGLNSVKNLLFGSVTSMVASISRVPVLVVPLEPTSEFSTKMMLAVDDLEIKNENIFDIPLEIARSNDVKIDILHIQTKEEFLPFDPILFLGLEERAGEIHLVKGGDVTQEVKDFCEKENTGLLIMIRRQKNLISKLLKVSTTTLEASMTNIPLMIIPEL